MIEGVLQLLDTNQHLLILNAYSLGFSALVPENLLKPFANKNKSELSIGELYLNAKSGVKLPLGVWGSLQKVKLLLSVFLSFNLSNNTWKNSHIIIFFTAKLISIFIMTL